jgi:hypothetical protein
MGMMASGISTTKLALRFKDRKFWIGTIWSRTWGRWEVLIPVFYEGASDKGLKPLV